MAPNAEFMLPDFHPSASWLGPRPLAEPVALGELSFLVTSERVGEVRLPRLNSLLHRLSQVCPNTEYLQASLLLYLFPAYDPEPDVLTRQLSHPQAYELYQRLRRIDGLELPLGNEKQLMKARNLVYVLSGDLQLLTALLLLRLHRCEHIEELPEDLQESFAAQSLHIYAPLAHRLGIFWIKAELEDSAFQYLQPEKYYQLKRLVSKKRHQRSAIVESMSRQIRHLLRQAGIPNQVYGRYKRFYSIHEKLEKVDQEFGRIQDLIALRIILDDVKDCYATLSYIHEQWPQRETRYKDYIAQPKPNGYQSLHTTVQTEQGDAVEIQIRTHEMHAVAEYGVAAHWLYKESNRQSAQSASMPPQLQGLDSAAKHIYLLTPNNDIVELPQGATPVDFAYAVHTEIGSQITGAKINGSIGKIDAVLQSGDRIEVLTSPRQRPSKEWLGFVKTHKARNKIRQSVHAQQRDEFRRKAWDLLESEFRQHGLNLNRMVRENRLDIECQQRKAQSFEHVLHCIAQGSLRAGELVQWFVEPVLNPTIPATEPVPEFRISKEFTPAGRGQVLVEGLEEVETVLSKCCQPTRQDPIVGYLSRNRVIKVHRQDCDVLSSLEPERLLPVRWNLPTVGI